MKVVVAGTGYVGLVTGVALAHIGHHVTCVDVVESKLEMLKNGVSPIYEEGLEELMRKNKERLMYTSDYKNAYQDADVIIIGVGTPEREDGSADLHYVYGVCAQIAESITRDCIVVVKSTVPIGTNDEIEQYFKDNVQSNIRVDVVSNPEFLAQGTAVRDTLYASRIVVGAETEHAREVMHKLYEPLTVAPYQVPYLVMNRRSAEMVKYASNDFLALKLSYVNEIANLCEKLGADITNVTLGMSLDGRIGDKFLKAGIGYGGSCFPKDTKALHHLSCKVGSEMQTIKACISVNESQKLKLIEKYISYFEGRLNGLNVAILGVTYKPGTDDLRDAPSIDNVKKLLSLGANITVYDPIGLERFKSLFGDKVQYADTVEKAITNKDATFIMTEWPEIKNFALARFVELMKEAVVFDGRNCFNIDETSKVKQLHYFSIGRP